MSGHREMLDAVMRSVEIETKNIKRWYRPDRGQRQVTGSQRRNCLMPRSTCVRQGTPRQHTKEAVHDRRGNEGT